MTPSVRLSVAALVATALAALSAQARPDYDLVVRGGSVVDGSGRAGVRTDVGVRDGQIAAMGALGRATAREVLDATGLVVAPGFIDVHTHADDIAEAPLAENFVRMGVTSVVAGNCGRSALDIGASLARIGQVGVSVNYATLIGHGTIRRAVLGTTDRAPNASELTRMRALVWRGMADGAVGLSTGLEYVPGAYASSFEVITLTRIAADAGGLYASHMRNEGTAVEAAIDETIRVGRAVGCPVEISHLKIDSPSRWGRAAQILTRIDVAREQGVEVSADVYAYTAGGADLSVQFPAWALEGGMGRIRRRLEDPETWARIKAEMRSRLAERGFEDLSFAVVASHSPDPTLNGLSMKRVALRLRGNDSAEAQFEAARVMLLEGGASMIYHVMSEDDVTVFMRYPHVAVASDAPVSTPGPEMPHPRDYGNHARVLGEYVRRRQVIPFEEAIRKMTSLPAQHFRFARRGLIAVGYAADLTIIDPERVDGPASFETPHVYATGIPWVIVNGVVVVRDGGHTGARPGQILTLEKPSE